MKKLIIIIIIKKTVMQMFTAVVTSASVEWLFSTYGLVHTKLRNKLGNEKAGKLVFLYKALNSVLKMFF